MKLNFCKYSSTGNDFILIDNRSNMALKWPDLAMKLCHRRWGVGADGLILLQKSATSDFKMVIYNADGSEAEMCGNGTRAIVHFAKAILGVDTQANIQFQTQNSTYGAEINSNEVKVQMTEVGEIKKISHPDFKKYSFSYFIDTGVPHAVVEVSTLEKLDVNTEGKFLRFHSEFEKGANINFISTVSKGLAKVRTYERGVEAETYSCGTGVMACAKVLNSHYNWKFPISLETKGGLLKVDFDGENYFLIGPTQLVFQGEIEVE